MIVAPLNTGSVPCGASRSEEHTSELQSRLHLVCRLLLEKKKTITKDTLLNSTHTSNPTPRAHPRSKSRSISLLGNQHRHSFTTIIFSGHLIENTSPSPCS